MRSNPMIRRGFSDAQAYDGPAMTISGTRNKTFILVAITILVSIGSFLLSSSGSASSTSMAYGLTTISSIGALILALITTFKPQLAKTTSILYAVCEGILLGSISAIFNTYFEGIAIKTVFLTLLSVVLTLALYKYDPSIGGKVRKGVIIATLAICGVSLLGLVFSLFGIPFIFWGNSLVGIGFSLFVVGVAIANLIVDYDNIAMGANYGLPQHMEWYFAFGLLVTIIWLYIELLQLLAKVASRD